MWKSEILQYKKFKKNKSNFVLQIFQKKQRKRKHRNTIKFKCNKHVVFSFCLSYIKGGFQTKSSRDWIFLSYTVTMEEFHMWPKPGNALSCRRLFFMLVLMWVLYILMFLLVVCCSNTSELIWFVHENTSKHMKALASYLVYLSHEALCMANLMFDIQTDSKWISNWP